MDIDFARLKKIFDKAPVGIALLDLDRTVRACNPEFARIYGWDVDGILGTVLPIPEHQKDNYQALIRDLRQGLPFVGIETVRIRKDGSEFYARISGSPVSDGNGRVTGFVASIAVSEANHSEELERRNLEYLVHGSSDFMCVAGLDLKVLFINDSGREMVGISPDEDVEGWGLLELFVEASRPQLVDFVHSLRPTKSGVSINSDLGDRRTGATTPVSASFYLVYDPHTNEPISIGCVAKSIALDEDAKSTDAAFRILFENVSVALAMVDPSGYPLRANPTLCNLLGYTEEEMRTIAFARHVHPEDLPIGRSLFLQLIAGKRDDYEVVKRLLRKDRQVVPVKMKVFLVRDRDGKPKHSISIVEAITHSVGTGSNLRVAPEILRGLPGNSATQ